MLRAFSFLFEYYCIVEYQGTLMAQSSCVPTRESVRDEGEAAGAAFCRLAQPRVGPTVVLNSQHAYGPKFRFSNYRQESCRYVALAAQAALRFQLADDYHGRVDHRVSCL